MKAKDFVCYPAVFETMKDTKGNDVFNLYFPDLVDCVATGSDLAETIKQARDVLGVYLFNLEKENANIPEPSNPTTINVEENDKLIFIDLNMKLFRQKQNNKSVNRMITLPQSLDAEAKEAGLNFSWVMQEALRKKLDKEG